MRKHALTTATIALLALTGCSADNNAASTPETSQPNTSASASPSPTPSPSTSEAQSPEVTASATALAQEEADALNSVAPASPPASLQEKTFFSGTTLKGNDLLFYILPEDKQDELNDKMMGSGLTGSWGALCSEQAVPDQLSETGIITAEPNGGHEHVWRSLRYAVPESGNYTPEEADIVAQFLNDSSISQAGNMQCVAMNSELKSAGRQMYTSVTEGYYGGGPGLQDTVELY